MPQTYRAVIVGGGSQGLAGPAKPQIKHLRQ